ncbi:Crp/Fnr family transcriptional regulator [Maledivibacter halophilus]|uniref:cAMP-binding domain of CRP or a regulatory subunit of cAMP-dependent protein kinases n=1 Tax=Maledivibacter halophilus TaxID=36842 RepID=A0A1T5ILZ5_9FIRM|nr:Crp/Fnr family transcriptional regulator [Maledivibacter halophilus]SKC40028.1 cAMP-binding domain of CRP or a regulatory subunit of cAMP-dependent protein kinases [Maledivibacter halophilus]
MNLEKYLKILCLTDLFKCFSSEELLLLFNDNNYKLSQYKKNSIIHFESEKCLTLDIILKGEIIIQKIDEDGNVLTITKFNIGDAIGGNLLFGNNNTYPMTVTSKSDAVILHIKKDFVLQLCQTNKIFLIEFIKSISEKTFILTSKIKSISMKSLRESIIDFLNYEYYSQNTNKIKLNMTKKELAERLGVQRSSLSRELNKMRKDGLVVYDAHSITIKDFNIIKLKIIG